MIKLIPHDKDMCAYKIFAYSERTYPICWLKSKKNGRSTTADCKCPNYVRGRIDAFGNVLKNLE